MTTNLRCAIVFFKELVVWGYHLLIAMVLALVIFEITFAITTLFNLGHLGFILVLLGTQCLVCWSYLKGMSWLGTKLTAKNSRN